MWKLVHPDDRDMVRQRSLSRLAGQTPLPHYEFRIQRKDGEVRWVEVFSAITDHDGKPASQIAYIDITDRKQAEDALIASEEKFFVAFMHAPVMSAITTLKDGAYLEVNDKFLEISGFTRREILGQTSSEVGWIQDKDWRRIVDELQRHGRVSGIEITSYAKDGRHLDCIYTGELVTIGGVKRLLSMALDITARKRSEEALL